jgi:branched-chain amino acid transport system substrate-binding protein
VHRGASTGFVAPSKEPYKVGAIFAITGGASWLGEPERNTALMIAEQINLGGGINGHPLELIIEDTAGDETKTVNAAKNSSIGTMSLL